MKSNDLLKWVFACFVIWYVLRRTDVGREFDTDMRAIPQQLGVAEGLKSAIELVK
jgi:hypothetical protein